MSCSHDCTKGTQISIVKLQHMIATEVCGVTVLKIGKSGCPRKQQICAMLPCTGKDYEVEVVLLLSTGTNISLVELQGC